MQRGGVKERRPGRSRRRSVSVWDLEQTVEACSSPVVLEALEQVVEGTPRVDV